jgi:hypothetical protein
VRATARRCQICHTLMSVYPNPVTQGVAYFCWYCDGHAAGSPERGGRCPHIGQERTDCCFWRRR